MGGCEDCRRGAVATHVTDVKESFHFYPVLFYFRFPETDYAIARVALLALDVTALMQCAVADGPNSWIKSSSAANELGRASELLVDLLDDHFVVGQRRPSRARRLASALPRGRAPPRRCRDPDAIAV